MKILFLCKTFPKGPHEPIVSGEVKNAYYLARTMADLGHEVTVWANGATEETFDVGPIKVRRAPVPLPKGAFKTVTENLSDLKAFKRIFGAPDAGFDVVLNHRLTAPILLPQEARRRHGSAYVNTAHGTNWPEINANRYRTLRGTATWANGLVQRELDRKSYAVSDEVVSVSKFQEEELRDIYRIPEAKIATIRNGVDLSLYTPPAAEPEGATKTVMFVGRLVKKKGLELILEGAAELRKSRDDIRYCLVLGTDEYAKIKPQFFAQMDALGLSDICDVHWGVTEDDLPGLYQKADVFVAPSSGYESLPTVLLEALATGVPVLTTRAWGTLEVGLGDDMLLAERSLNEYTTKLSALLDKSHDRAALRALVSDIDWAKQTADYISLLQEARSS